MDEYYVNYITIMKFPNNIRKMELLLIAIMSCCLF